MWRRTSQKLNTFFPLHSYTLRPAAAIAFRIVFFFFFSLCHCVCHLCAGSFRFQHISLPSAALVSAFFRFWHFCFRFFISKTTIRNYSRHLHFFHVVCGKEHETRWIIMFMRIDPVSRSNCEIVIMCTEWECIEEFCVNLQISDVAMETITANLLRRNCNENTPCRCDSERKQTTKKNTSK